MGLGELGELNLVRYGSGCREGYEREIGGRERVGGLGYGGKRFEGKSTRRRNGNWRVRRLDP